jgi:hypothetical protein
MSELAKDLGLLEALTIGVGTMIGAGIFVLPGPARPPCPTERWFSIGLLRRLHKETLRKSRFRFRG